MADFISDIMGSTFLGVPTIVIIGFFVVVIFLIYKLKPKEKEFRRISLHKQIRKDLDESFRTTGEPINKPIKADGGFVKAGYAFGYFSFAWDKNIPLRAKLQYKDRVKKALREKAQPDYEDMTVFRCCDNTPLARFLGRFGLRNWYMIVPQDAFSVNSKELVLNQGLTRTDFFGVKICSQSGKEYLENIAFKLNRIAELDEFVNTVPKQNYLEIGTSGAAARAREKAAIEKEKYKGQIEGAESG